MGFGDFLDFAMTSSHHRLELDNRQMRRLSGTFTAKTFGQEGELLRTALHHALAPHMILGFVEHLDVLIAHLRGEGYLSRDTVETFNVSPNSEQYDVAIEALTPSQTEIFESFTVWDQYLYDVCYALLAPLER